MEGSFAFVEKHKKLGNCEHIYNIPGLNGTVSIWKFESADELSLRFLENPMSTYEEVQVYLLSDWDAFKNTTSKIYHRILTKQ